jgi:DNA polymerase III epsilon subunit-like protein
MPQLYTTLLLGREHPTIEHRVSRPRDAAGTGSKALDKPHFTAWLESLRSDGVSLRYDGEAFLFAWPDGAPRYQDLARAETNWEQLFAKLPRGVKRPQAPTGEDLPDSACYYGEAPTTRSRVTAAIDGGMLGSHAAPSPVINAYPLAFLDTESTGLDVSRGDRLIELAVCRVDPGAIEGQWLTGLVNPDGRASHPDAQSVHKIHADELALAPRFPDLAGAISRALTGAVVVAYGASFDKELLEAEHRRAGLPMPTVTAWLDACELARKLLPGKARYSLTAIAKELGVTATAAHRAVADVKTLRQVWGALIALAPTMSLAELERAARPRSSGYSPSPIVAAHPAPVGKHAAQTANEVEAQSTVLALDEVDGWREEDAEFGSSLARQIRQYGNLSDRQWGAAVKLSKRYPGVDRGAA